MSINFTCPSCSHDLQADPEMAGEAVDCPNCNTTVIVPAAKPLPRDLLKKSVEDAADGQQKLLRAILDEERVHTKRLESIRLIAVTCFVSVSILIGLCLFTYLASRDHNTSFIIAAKEALDATHKLESGVDIGLSFQTYGEELIPMADKVDSLLRVMSRSGRAKSTVEEKTFCDRLVTVRTYFKSARKMWELKVRYPDQDNKDLDKHMNEDWTAASKALSEADAIFVVLSPAL